jgi:two-component system, OmpR family, sensor histidine kinase CiaH
MAERSAPDVFARAQLRLALLFAGIVIALVLVSSLFMYLTVRSDIRTAAQRSFGDGETEQEYVTRSLGTLRWQLVAVDGVIVAIIGVVGLLFAHGTLRPIRANVAAQKRFIADASHELRTPLAVMRSEFEVSLRGLPPGAETRQVLESGLEEVERMSEMVEDLLTLSRIDAHQEQVAVERIDLADLAAQTTQKFRALAAEAGVALRFAADGPAPAAGDARHVRRALSNVVRNAVEHSSRGAEVEVTVRRSATAAEATVADHGEGIPPEALTHVFDRFYRVDPARSQVRGGAGLGLAISRWALREMGGDIRLESAPGSGTRATISLPVPRS